MQCSIIVNNLCSGSVPGVKTLGLGLIYLEERRQKWNIFGVVFYFKEAQEDTIRETCGLLKEERRAVTNLAVSSGKAEQKKEIL